MTRDINAVLQDVIDDYVSIEGAARDYGVVIEPGTMTVDTAATETLRASLSSSGDGFEIRPRSSQGDIPI